MKMKYSKKHIDGLRNFFEVVDSMSMDDFNTEDGCDKFVGASHSVCVGSACNECLFHVFYSGFNKDFCDYCFDLRRYFTVGSDKYKFYEIEDMFEFTIEYIRFMDKYSEIRKHFESICKNNS